MMINPFICSRENKTFSSLILDDDYDYDNIYIIVPTKDDDLNGELYKQYIDIEIYNKIINNFILIECKKNILMKNTIYNNYKSLIDKNDVEIINKLNYKLTDKIVGILILNMTYHNLNLYLSQFTVNTFVDFYKILFINKYFNSNINIINKIKNIDEINDWNNYMYVGFNDRFIKREFPIKEIKMNEYNIINLNKNYIYPIMYNFVKSNIIEFNKDEIYELFITLNDKERYYLFCTLLITKDYCHLVLNNHNLLILMKQIIYKYIMIFRYLIGYAWLNFYLQECNNKTNITKNDTFIFDINTASELPIFPFIICQPKLNPYMSLLINHEGYETVGGLSDVSYDCNSNSLLNCGITNLEKFKTNLNIFITGKSEIDIFSGINWNKIAIGGSSICACIQEKNPLINKFNNYSSEERLNRYYNEYYADSDIDIMVLSDSIFEFMDIIYETYDIIKNNIMEFNPISRVNDIILEPINIIYVYISESDLRNITNINIEYIKKNIDSPNVIEILKDYIDIKLNEFVNKTNNSKYPDYTNFKNSKYKIKITKDYTNLVVRYKYKIISSYIYHNLELFMIKNKDPFSSVVDFHLPCVRGYYNGENVYLTPSCITAHLTYMNIDYKYFASTQSPIHIINKYRMRGFGTWLNKSEIKDYIEYCKNDDYWKNLFLDSKSYLGTLQINNNLFFPRLYNSEHYSKCLPINLTLGYYNFGNYSKLTHSHYFDEINIRFNNKKVNHISFLESLRTIDNNGEIIPIQYWTIDTVFNIMNLY